MMYEWWRVWNDLEGIGRGLIEVLPRPLIGGTEENHGKPHDIRCPGRDPNWVPLEYKSRALPPRQPVHFHGCEDLDCGLLGYDTV
jgi:hypothetical protein